MNVEPYFVYKKSIFIESKLKEGTRGTPTRFAALVPRKEDLFNDCKTMSDKMALLQRLVNIVNHAYVVGEHSMWTENIRTDCDDLENKLENEMIILLIKGTKVGNVPEKNIINENSIIGQILCNTEFDREHQLAEFGKFAIQEEYQNLGLGKFLISAAEERARFTGCKRF